MSTAQQQIIRGLGLLGETDRARGQRERDHRLYHYFPGHFFLDLDN
jgi:hypothetical protein